MATIKVNGKTISYIKKAQPVITDITFSDGVVAQTIGSSAAAAVLKAYKDKIATPPVIPPVDPPVTPPVVVEGKEISYEEFAKLSNAEGLILKVKAGTYNYGATNSNLKNCTIDLTGVVVQNTNSALRIVDKSVNVNYKGLICKNISGYQVEIINKQVYTGAEGTFVDRLTLNGFSFDGGGQPIHSDGNIRGGKLDGVLKGAKILNTTIKNIPNAGDMIYIGMGIDVEVGYATFYNVNTGNNNHNGLIRVHGNVLVHHIVATSYQGNVVRNWLYSGEGVKTTEVHNVIGYKSRKYGLIELQMEPNILANGGKVANAIIHDNTAISLSTSKDWDAQILDLYNIGKSESDKSSLVYYNNLGADLNGTKPVTDLMINGMDNPAWSTKDIRNNKYFTNPTDAVQDFIYFKSKVSGIGASIL